MKIGSIFLDKYAIEKVIGSGGMGCVYLASKIDTQKHCAIKEERITTENRKLLETEVQIMQKLHHPAFPKIWQIHVDNEHYYIVMDYIEGITLSKMLEQEKRFEETRVLKWFKHICDIFVYLHGLEKPVVYRDFKPSNIIIDQNDNVKLIDFGISQEYQKDYVIDKRYLTLTKGYAAPEQYDVRYRSDVRTDIYALGVTMHYLLTGKNPKEPPFHFVPVRRMNPTISRAMESIVKKCLQPNPDKRYADACLLKEDIYHIDKLEKKIRKAFIRKIWISCGVLLACIIVLAGFFATVKQRRESKINAYYALLEEADSQEAESAFEDAKKLLETAIEKQPEAEDAYLQMAELYLEQEDYGSCFQYISEQILPKFPDIYEDVYFLDLMGRLYSEQKQYADALFYYENRCAIDSNNMDYLFELAMCQIQNGKRNAAEKSIQMMEKESYDETMIQTLKELL